MNKLDNNVFLGKMQLLIDQFGDKKFSAYKQKLIYDTVKTLNEKQFGATIDKIIGNFKYAPSVAEISELTRSYRNENASRIVCEQCSNSGFILLYKRLTGENIAFKCKCENAPQHLNIRGYWEIDKKEYTRLAPSIIDMSGKKDCYKNYKDENHKVNVDKFVNEFGKFLR
jgi:hypothetical protein